MRRGFTLVETVVALLLVQFGLLAVAAMSAVAARDVATATRVSRARDVARERIEQLRLAACTATGEGSLAAAAHSEHWWVRGDSVVRRIRDSVEYRLPGGRSGRVVIEQAVLCT